MTEKWGERERERGNEREKGRGIERWLFHCQKISHSQVAAGTRAGPGGSQEPSTLPHRPRHLGHLLLAWGLLAEPGQTGPETWGLVSLGHSAGPGLALLSCLSQGLCCVLAVWPVLLSKQVEGKLPPSEGLRWGKVPCVESH